MRAAAAIIVLALLACAALASHQRKPFELWIEEAEASTIVCTPQPVPALIEWHRKKRSEA